MNSDFCLTVKLHTRAFQVIKMKVKLTGLNTICKTQISLHDVLKINFILYEPVHEISNNVVCATSKTSDQPAHTRSLIRAFASRLSIL